MIITGLIFYLRSLKDVTSSIRQVLFVAVLSIAAVAELGYWISLFL